MTNLDLPGLLNTPESEAKAKSYYKSPRNTPTVKTDDLWRFLYVQATSIENFISEHE